MPSSLEKILQIRLHVCRIRMVQKTVDELEAAAYLDRPGAVVARLKDVVPSFSPVAHSETVDVAERARRN